MTYEKTRNALRELRVFCFVFSSSWEGQKELWILLTETKSLNQGTVALDVFSLQVVEESATLTYQLYESAFCHIIFTVRSHVLRQMGNTVRKQGHLAFY